ncbi:MAG: S8 family peptidase [Bacillota bacterium]|nr:S8 family peptidase [Bacillota bacterium]MDW7683135.1 S8 family peptidase [Bacillota bacterium]
MFLIVALVMMMLAPAVMARPLFSPGQNNSVVDVLISFDRHPGPKETALVREMGGTIKYTYSMVPGIAASLPEAAVSSLLRNPSVVSVDLDGEVYAIGSETAYEAELNNAWGVKHIGAGAVHEAVYMGSGVKVAILDSGIAIHEDLTIAGGVNFTRGNSNNYDDKNGHGTHVAGTVAALRNGYGVVGTAPEVELYAVKVLGNGGMGNWSDIIAGIEWAMDNGIQVTNNSYGSKTDPGELVQAAFDKAYYERGIIHVAAAGNSGNSDGTGENVGYPAAYESVIAVAATDINNERAGFSSTGPQVELAAPGVGINSTYLNNEYRELNGTSMASPHVAGVAALVWAYDTSLTNTELRALLQTTAKDLGMAYNLQGHGLVRADLAIAALGAPDSGTGSLTVGVSASPDTFENAKELGSTLTVTVTDENGSGVNGLQSENFSTSVNGEEMVIIFSPTTAAGTYTAELSVGNWLPGDYVVTVAVVDDNGASGSGSTTITVTGETDQPGTVNVFSIEYVASGGRNNNKNLAVNVSLIDGMQAPVSDATVTIEIYRNNKLYTTTWGTTDLEGIMSFTINNAPAGTYTTIVTAVDAGGLEWDGTTPDNIYTK